MSLAFVGTLNFLSLKQSLHWLPTCTNPNNNKKWTFRSGYAPLAASFNSSIFTPPEECPLNFNTWQRKLSFDFNKGFYTRGCAKWFQARCYRHCGLWRAELYYCYLLLWDFLIHLPTSCKNCTIINYVSAINVLHQHFGHSVTIQEPGSQSNWPREGSSLFWVMNSHAITPNILWRTCLLLSANVDSGFWAPTLRKTYLVPTSLFGNEDL